MPPPPATTLAAPAQPAATKLQAIAYAELRRLIVSGEFPPSTFLSERQLARQLNMSKTPVHVALKRLEAEGFVTISAQQGIVVRGMSIEDIMNHYELREAIECWVVSRIAGKLDAGQQRQLLDNLAAQKEALEAGDLPELMRLDETMHFLMASFLGNRELIASMERLRDKITQVIIRVSDTDRRRPRESTEEHEGIVEAWIAGDGDRASKLMIQHLEAGKRCIFNPERFFR